MPYLEFRWPILARILGANYKITRTEEQTLEKIYLGLDVLHIAEERLHIFLLGVIGRILDFQDKSLVQYLSPMKRMTTKLQTITPIAVVMVPSATLVQYWEFAILKPLKGKTHLLFAAVHHHQGHAKISEILGQGHDVLLTTPELFQDLFNEGVLDLSFMKMLFLHEFERIMRLAEAPLQKIFNGDSSRNKLSGLTTCSRILTNHCSLKSETLAGHYVRPDKVHTLMVERGWLRKAPKPVYHEYYEAYSLYEQICNQIHAIGLASFVIIAKDEVEVCELWAYLSQDDESIGKVRVRQRDTSTEASRMPEFQAALARKNGHRPIPRGMIARVDTNQTLEERLSSWDVFSLGLKPIVIIQEQVWEAVTTQCGVPPVHAVIATHPLSDGFYAVYRLVTWFAMTGQEMGPRTDTGGLHTWVSQDELEKQKLFETRYQKISRSVYLPAASILRPPPA